MLEVEQLLEIAHNVHEALGGGLSESIYHAAMTIALRNAGRLVECEVVVPVYYSEMYVGFVRPDMLVDKRMVIELKAVAKITEAHMVQLRTYMRWFPKDVVAEEGSENGSSVLGVLINFGAHGVQLQESKL